MTGDKIIRGHKRRRKSSYLSFSFIKLGIFEERILRAEKEDMALLNNYHTDTTVITLMFVK